MTSGFGAAVTRALRAGVPAVLVMAGVVVLLAAAAAGLYRATRRRDDLDAEWAAVAPRWAGWDSPR